MAARRAPQREVRKPIMEESVWPEQTADRSLVAGTCCHLPVPGVKELRL